MRPQHVSFLSILPGFLDAAQRRIEMGYRVPRSWFDPEWTLAQEVFRRAFTKRLVENILRTNPLLQQLMKNSKAA